MIAEAKIYVVGRGFVPIGFVSPGDRVYRLNGLQPEIGRVESISSEFINQKINVIHTGIQSIEATQDTRYLYLSDDHGVKYLAFEQIDSYTPNKEYDSRKYLPILSMPFFEGKRNKTDQELEFFSRMFTSSRFLDQDLFLKESKAFTGEDAFIFIDLLEHWASDHPGLGAFGKLNRKSRAFYMREQIVADEISRLACLAGMSTMVVSSPAGVLVQIFFDGRPIPGDVPKTQKYTKKHYCGTVYSLNSANMPIFGRFGTRAYYLPCTSILNGGV